MLNETTGNLARLPALVGCNGTLEVFGFGCTYVYIPIYVYIGMYMCNVCVIYATRSTHFQRQGVEDEIKPFLYETAGIATIAAENNT